MAEQPTFNLQYQFRDGEVRVILEGLEVMRVLFSSDHLSKALFEKLKLSEPFLQINDEQRARIRERLEQAALHCKPDLGQVDPGGLVFRRE